MIMQDWPGSRTLHQRMDDLEKEVHEHSRYIRELQDAKPSTPEPGPFEVALDEAWKRAPSCGSRKVRSLIYWLNRGTDSGQWVWLAASALAWSESIAPGARERVRRAAQDPQDWSLLPGILAFLSELAAVPSTYRLDLLACYALRLAVEAEA